MGAVNAVAPTAKLSIIDTGWRRDRCFFMGMAVAAAVAVFVGFYPTYYLKVLWGMPALPPLVHLHPMLFTSWVILLLTQTSLIAVRRTDLHRRLVIGGDVLAALMTIVGFVTAITAVQRGRNTLQFLVVPMGSVVVFPVLVGVALLMRRNTDFHKRLMLIATTELLIAATGRWPVIWRSSALVNYGVTDLFVVAVLIYDIITRQRPHPATIWGGSFLVASQMLRTAIGHTDAWLVFARWLTS